MDIKEEIYNLEKTINHGSIGYDAHMERKFWMKAIKNVAHDLSKACPYCGSTRNKKDFNEHYRSILLHLIKEFL